ncbi:hypothetical protein [Bacteroides thetaiotaomicron]|uniref:hypothetical protein n=1 Tax=Bacteroides thetaiotaomicron TaxID=818 RepID=UPI0012BC141E|nr:hypothetical protein [Bacteroides thetaiotaomicron]
MVPPDSLFSLADRSRPAVRYYSVCFPFHITCAVTYIPDLNPLSVLSIAAYTSTDLASLSTCYPMKQCCQCDKELLRDCKTYYGFK